MKLTRKEMTVAVAEYARRNGFSVSTVRANTKLRIAAIYESTLYARKVANDLRPRS